MFLYRFHPFLYMTLLWFFWFFVFVFLFTTSSDFTSKCMCISDRVLIISNDDNLCCLCYLLKSNITVYSCLKSILMILILIVFKDLCILHFSLYWTQVHVISSCCYVFLTIIKQQKNHTKIVYFLLLLNSILENIFSLILKEKHNLWIIFHWFKISKTVIGEMIYKWSAIISIYWKELQRHVVWKNIGIIRKFPLEITARWIQS